MINGEDHSEDLAAFGVIQTIFYVAVLLAGTYSAGVQGYSSSGIPSFSAVSLRSLESITTQSFEGFRLRNIPRE